MTSTGPIATGELPPTAMPPLDGRDVSRIATSVRLAQLALTGLLVEEGAQSGTHERVLSCLRDAEVDLDSALDTLGQALIALVEEHGAD